MNALPFLAETRVIEVICRIRYGFLDYLLDVFLETCVTSYFLPFTAFFSFTIFKINQTLIVGFSWSEGYHFS